VLPHRRTEYHTRTEAKGKKKKNDRTAKKGQQAANSLRRLLPRLWTRHEEKGPAPNGAGP